VPFWKLPWIFPLTYEDVKKGVDIAIERR